MWNLNWTDLLIIIIGVILVYVVLILFINLKASMCFDKPIISIQNIDNLQLKTGDILTVSYKHAFGKFISAWSSSIMSHPAIFYKNVNGEKFIIEAACYDKEYRHVIQIPFDKWLEYNKGHNLYYSKYNGPVITDAAIESTFKKYKHFKLDSFSGDWVRLLKVTQYSEFQEGQRYVCYEITVAMLQDLQIVQKKYNGNSYWPKHIAYGTLDYMDGVSYNYPVCILDARSKYYSLPQIKHKNKLKVK